MKAKGKKHSEKAEKESKAMHKRESKMDEMRGMSKGGKVPKGRKGKC